MAGIVFRVGAVWDDEAGVYVSESDIRGLHIEARTLEEFEQLVLEHAGDLVLANHVTKHDIAGRPLRELLPTIVLLPATGRAAA